MDHEQFSRAIEQLASEMPQRALLRGCPLNSRKVTMTAALGSAIHVALALKRSENGQDGGVSKRVPQCLLDLTNKRRAALPEHFHDIDFAIGELDVHVRLSY